MLVMSMRLYQFQRLVHDRFPDLFEHFSEKFINADLYAAEWFLSCFSSTFPLLFVLEFFDQVMAVGIPAVFRMGLGLLEHEAEKLLAQDDEEELLYHLKVKVAQMPSLKLKRILRESASVAFDSEFLRELELEFLMLRQEADTETKLRQAATVWDDEREELLKENELLRKQVESLKRGNTRMEDEMDAAKESSVVTKREHTHVISLLANEKVALQQHIEELEDELVRSKLMCAQEVEKHDQLQHDVAKLTAELRKHGASLPSSPRDVDGVDADGVDATASSSATTASSPPGGQDKPKKRFAFF